MNTSTEAAFEAATNSQLFSDHGLKILHDSLMCNLPAETALTRVAMVAIEKTVAKGKARQVTIAHERIEQIVTPLMNRPEVRGRLRKAGYKITIRSEVEFSYMEATV